MNQLAQMRKMYGLFAFMNCEKWLHSRGNVGKYCLHGASGQVVVSNIKYVSFVSPTWGDDPIHIYIYIYTFRNISLYILIYILHDVEIIYIRRSLIH